MQDGPLQILHDSWILGVLGRNKLEAGLEIVDGHIRHRVHEFPQLVIFSNLFKRRWEHRMDSLPDPLQALHLGKRSEAISRDVAVSVEYAKESIERYTGKFQKKSYFVISRCRF